jgi:hypothetical protein
MGHREDPQANLTEGCPSAESSQHTNDPHSQTPKHGRYIYWIAREGLVLSPMNKCSHHPHERLIPGPPFEELRSLIGHHTVLMSTPT